jgi:diguanylate cyclase (GGDEF)-like protein
VSVEWVLNSNRGTDRAEIHGVITFLTILLVLMNVALLVAGVIYFRPTAVAIRQTDNQSAAHDGSKSVALWGAINETLSHHADSLSHVDHEGTTVDAQQMGQCVEELRRTNRATGDSIDDKNKQLETVLDKYGSVYRSERRRLESYTQHVYELDDLLAEFEKDAEDDNRVLLRFVRDMVQENRQLQVKVSDAQEQVTELITRSVKSERDARTDSLTKLPNRRAWDEQLVELESSGSLSIALVDVNDFKSVNDTHGHAAGDAMLTMIGTILRKVHEITAYRIGGDEFALLLPNDQAEAIAVRVRKKVAGSVLQFGDQKLSTSISIGVSRRLENESIHSMLCRADDALYEAKDARREHLRSFQAV